MTPTARTLQWLKARGYLAGVVERWNPHARIRQDLFGCVDIVAVKGSFVSFWQATSGGNVSSRVSKIRELPHAEQLFASGALVYVIGWRKRKIKRGGKAVRWEPRILLVDQQGELEVFQS